MHTLIQQIRCNMGNLSQYIRHEKYESALSELSVLSLRMAVLSDQIERDATPSPQREAMAGARTACHAEEPGLLTAVDKPAIGWVHDVEEKVTTIGRAGKYYVFPPSAQPATQREEDHS